MCPYPNAPLDYLGRHQQNEVYYFRTGLHELDSLPTETWVCLGISNKEFDKDFFEEFVCFAASSGLLECKGQGKKAELLHDLFDQAILEYEFQKEVTTEIMTSWYNDEVHALANCFWGCFYANVLPDNVSQNSITVVCIGFDNQDYRVQLKGLLDLLNQGWIPPDEE